MSISKEDEAEMQAFLETDPAGILYPWLKEKGHKVIDLNRLQDLLYCCESPIEERFISGFIKNLCDPGYFGAGRKATNIFFKDAWEEVEGSRLLSSTNPLKTFLPYREDAAYDTIIVLQEHIDKYRVDFLIAVYERTVSLLEVKRKPIITFVIECDGHDYHERTKEQARHDREKDRTMQLLGLRIFRYTGSEIYRDPQCSRSLITLIESAIHEKGQLIH